MSLRPDDRLRATFWLVQEKKKKKKKKRRKTSQPGSHEKKGKKHEYGRNPNATLKKRRLIDVDLFAT